jgi:hypothetical protein
LAPQGISQVEASQHVVKRRGGIVGCKVRNRLVVKGKRKFLERSEMEDRNFDAFFIVNIEIGTRPAQCSFSSAAFMFANANRSSAADAGCGEASLATTMVFVRRTFRRARSYFGSGPG